MSEEKLKRPPRIGKVGDSVKPSVLPNVETRIERSQETSLKAEEKSE